MTRLFSILAASLFALAALAHDDAGPRGTQKIGKVNFPPSCNEHAQAHMQRAVAMLHSFWWPEGERAFQEIAAEDPGCAAIAARGFASLPLSHPSGRRAPPR